MVKPSLRQEISQLAAPMDSSNVCVPVFVDTNLDTHFAVQVSSDITAGKFKRDLESLHSNYFPEIGSIRVHRIMVKRRSCFYHLPDTFPIKHVFHGIKGTWFISLEAYPVESYERKFSKCVAEEVQDHVSDNNAMGTKRKNRPWKRKKRKRKIFYGLKFVLKELFRSVNLPKKTKRRKMLAESLQVEERTQHCSSVAAPSQTLSETISVSGLIEKYFSGYDEVTSRSFGQFRSRTDVRCLNIKIDRTRKCAEKTRPGMILLPFPAADGRSEPSRDELRGGKVGKSIVLASGSVGICASKQKPTVNLCRFSERKASDNLFLNSSTLVRSLVFEINDEDD